MSDEIYGTPPALRQRILGRDDLLAKVKNALKEGLNVGVFSGLPGAGKTALAAELARDLDLRGHFRDGIVWVSLGRDRDAHRSKLLKWGEQLGLASAELETLAPDELEDAIRRMIGERRMLVILDDVWSYDDGRAFQLGGGNAPHLITTRSPDVARSLCNVDLHMDELKEQDALALLARYAPKVVDEFPDKALQIVQLSGRLPLSLVLIGSYLRRRGTTRSGRERALAEVDAKWFLDAKVIGPDVEWIEKSLKLAIARSEEELGSLQLQQAFRRLTVFPPKSNDFPAAAGEHVAACPGAIQGISEHGLIDLFDDTHDRYAMHQAIWEYAQVRDTDPDAYRRMADYFIRYIDEQERTATSDAWITGLERERENLHAALNWAIKSVEVEIALHLANKLFKFWYERSHFEDGTKAARRILDLTGVHDPSFGEARAKLQNDLGNYLYSQGRIDDAADAWRASFETRTALGLRQDMAGSLNNLALVDRHRGDLPAAEQRLDDALEINRELGRRDWQAKNLNNLGLLAHLRGAAEVAIERQERSLEIFSALNDRWGMAMALNDLGLAQLATGDVAAARTACAESLRLRGELNDSLGRASSHRALAEIAAREGDEAAVIDDIRQALELSSALKDEAGAADGLAMLAIHVESRRNPEQAAALLGAVDAWRARLGLASVARESEAVTELERALGDALFTPSWHSRRSGSLCELIPLAIDFPTELAA